MAANLRRGNLPTADTMARFLYYIVKQLDVRGVDWTEVADNMDITNGHAARMRYARYKNQVEGVAPKPREPRPSSSTKKGPGRPVKRQKVEKREEGEDGDGRGVKKESTTGSPKAAKMKREGGAGGEGVQGKEMPEAKMSGALGQGAGIKREYNDVDAEGEETGSDNLNPMDLTIRTGSTMSEQGKPPSRKGSGLMVKSEPIEDGGSPKRTCNVGNADADAPGEFIDVSELSAMTLSQDLPSTSPQSILAYPTTAQNSPHTTPLDPALSQATVRSDNQTSPSNIPFTMQHLQLNSVASLPMQHTASHTPPPPPHQLPSSNHGLQGSYIQPSVSTYPAPAYFTRPMRELGQSPATTSSSSAAFSLPPSPSNVGFNGDLGGRGYGMSGNGMAFDMGSQHQVENGMLMNQGGFVGMLEDPGFPRGHQEGQGGFLGGDEEFGGWEGMY